MRSARVAVSVACIAIAAACESFTEVIGPAPFFAELAGTNVRPGAVDTDATGTMTASLTVARRLAYTVTWSGLSAVVEGAHLHGPADANGVAEILVDFAVLPAGSTGELIPDAAGSATGELDLTLPVTPTVSGDSLVTLIHAGLVYIDLHTQANPNGEIRGNLRGR